MVSRLLVKLPLMVVAPDPVVTAMALSGRLDFNPATDTLTNADGEQVKLDPPVGDELPKQGFGCEDPGYVAPAADGSRVGRGTPAQVERLSLATPRGAVSGDVGGPRGPPGPAASCTRMPSGSGKPL